MADEATTGCGLSTATAFRRPDFDFRTSSSRKRITTAVLLSGREKFSPYFGGALARWTYEVYSRLTENLDVEVLGFPVSSRDRYPLPHKSSRVSSACNLVSGILFLRRFEDQLWLRSLAGDVCGRELVHILNRPQWVHSLRGMGYQGKLILHLQNDHLGHWSGTMLDELASKLDMVIVCSAYLRNIVAARSRALALKTRVLFNGVDIERFFPHPPLRERKTIFYVGRFHQEKGVLQLVRAYARVLRSHPDARLVIGGATGFGEHEETNYVTRVRQEAAAIVRAGGDIKFAGYIHHDRDLPEYFRRATVFVCPSLFQEPFGLVNAEAMACGTPVVGSNRGGIPEVLGDCGLLVDPEDTVELAEALVELLNEPKRCATLADAGRDRCCSLFDWAVVAKNFLALVCDIFEGNFISGQAGSCPSTYCP